MTTTSRNYLYTYEILQLVPIQPGFRVQIGTSVFPVIALAHVEITVYSAINPSEESGKIDVWRELRYITVNESGEPDIEYKENPEYKGVK